jgi:hypothetical protein
VTCFKGWQEELAALTAAVVDECTCSSAAEAWVLSIRACEAGYRSSIVLLLICV